MALANYCMIPTCQRRWLVQVPVPGCVRHVVELESCGHRLPLPLKPLQQFRRIVGRGGQMIELWLFKVIAFELACIIGILLLIYSAILRRRP